MATFDQLSAEQRAIIELVLQRGQSYADLADSLGMPAARVRTLARDALGELSPRTARGVEPDWRDQIADYLLRQQSGPESTATRGHLRRSEPARVWASSVLDSLDGLYANGAEPDIPQASGRERAPRRRGEGAPAARVGELLGASGSIRRRRIVAGAGVVLGLAFLWFVPISLISGNGWFRTGGDEEKEKGRTTRQREVGLATVYERNGRLVLQIAAGGLKPTTARQAAYEVALTNGNDSGKSIGFQRTDREGRLGGEGSLPKDFRKFRFVAVFSVRFERERVSSRTTALRGQLSQLQRPQPGQASAGPDTRVIGQLVLLPPGQTLPPAGQGAPQGQAP